MMEWDATPNKNQSKASPSSGDISRSAFGSRRQILWRGVPERFIRSRMPSWWQEKAARGGEVPDGDWPGAAGTAKAVVREALDGFERDASFIVAFWLARIRMCYLFLSEVIIMGKKDLLRIRV